NIDIKTLGSELICHPKGKTTSGGVVSGIWNFMKSTIGFFIETNEVVGSLIYLAQLNKFKKSFYFKKLHLTIYIFFHYGNFHYVPNEILNLFLFMWIQKMIQEAIASLTLLRNRKKQLSQHTIYLQNIVLSIERNCTAQTMTHSLIKFMQVYCWNFSQPPVDNDASAFLANNSFFDTLDAQKPLSYEKEMKKICLEKHYRSTSIQDGFIVVDYDVDNLTVKNTQKIHLIKKAKKYVDVSKKYDDVTSTTESMSKSLVYYFFFGKFFYLYSIYSQCFQQQHFFHSKKHKASSLCSGIALRKRKSKSITDDEDEIEQEWPLSQKRTYYDEVIRLKAIENSRNNLLCNSIPPTNHSYSFIPFATILNPNTEIVNVGFNVNGTLSNDDSHAKFLINNVKLQKKCENVALTTLCFVQSSFVFYLFFLQDLTSQVNSKA
ncbi:hypothetical protein RFI_10606, partial [Reticulomyxa filosa]